MESSKKDCCFQQIILNILGNKLNLMLTELFQLNEEIDFNDYHKLTRIVLKEISRGNILSAHMSQQSACLSIYLLDYLDNKKEISKDDKNYHFIDQILSKEIFISGSPF